MMVKKNSMGREIITTEDSPKGQVEKENEIISTHNIEEIRRRTADEAERARLAEEAKEGVEHGE